MARIRDNQRRSRARRKEYLQELEAKNRECEQAGVQASAEVQQAAKKVLEENRRLRALLRQQGYADAQIDSMPLDLESYTAAGAAQVLENVLSSRKRCLSRSPPDHHNGMHQPATPASTASSTSQPISYSRYSTPSSSIQHYPSPQSTVSVPNMMPTAVPKMEGPHRSALAQEYRMTTDDVAWFQEQYRRVQQPCAPTSMADTSSCYTAADAIRIMNPHLEPELDDLAPTAYPVPNPDMIYMMRSG